MIKLLGRKEVPYDMAKMPEDFLKIEYPEYYNSLKKRKYEDPMMYFS
ncbi:MULTISPECIES: hypothetical protein [Metallosphaera]|uniref:Uncharacterized protein n=2 Tax=Metallosphaera sedula TaxID=43687 RepID=A4YG81_METS5|nr:MULTISPECIES: hypothetical protein [Metallosphaera]ABP95433.1 hypothetical protein Msed_1273 [Metallosphaera sedula DSM 5348]AIM27418.1 hypothetical protein HA72_1273 [Metallosphaera sedula]MCH1770354.1 hypothetical protein [Metallosphaera sedula]MCP6727812.1 hypothetical protein [Metallosphaera sedula]MCY0861659.1 hypothetical protein [Metallosphaera prunae]